MTDRDDPTDRPDLQGIPDLGADELPLPDPYPEYLICPYCGEPEVEVWCYQTGVYCHNCGGWIEHQRPDCFGADGCWVFQKTKKPAS